MLRVHGDLGSTKHQFKAGGSQNDVVISLRSLVWPGLVYISKDNLLASLYVGDGQKYTTEIYFPKFPYLIMSEPTERKENAEVPL
jgi:hypothetical protein